MYVSIWKKKIGFGGAAGGAQGFKNFSYKILVMRANFEWNILK